MVADLTSYIDYTLDNVGDHQCGGVLIALDIALTEVTFDLQAEQVPGELFLQLTGVWRVELDTEV